MRNLNCVGKFKKNILKSIFLRKGGEGGFTKVIDSNNNEFSYIKLKQDEQIVINYDHLDERLLLTNKRILYCNCFSNGMLKEINLSSIIKIEYLSTIKEMTNCNEFNRIRAYDLNELVYELKIEKGAPFNGLYQVLHYITIQNVK